VGEAIVGGLIGAAALLLGIGMNEWLTRVRARRDRVEQAAHGLLNAVAANLAFLRLTREAAAGADAQSSVRYTLTLVATIRSAAKWPMKDHAEIANEADEIAVRIIVAIMNWLTKGPCPPDQINSIAGGRLHELVFGGTTTIDDKINTALRDAGLLTLEDFGNSKPPKLKTES
jgi:hypothetical protein